MENNFQQNVTVTVTLTWLVVLNGMTHVIVSIVVVLVVFIWVFGDAVPVMVSANP
jgi:hypothetical protein